MKCLWYFGRCPFEIGRWVCGTSGDVETLSRSVGRWVGGTSGGVGTLSGSVGRAVSERCREVSGGGWWSCERNN